MILYMKPSEANTDLGTPTVRFNYKGVWDMDDLYKTIAEFFKKHKFKFYEKQQRHRHPSPFGVERLYQWEATKDVEDYYRWTVTLWMETFDEHDVEIVKRNGKKKTMTKGKLLIGISGKVTLDYEKKWENSMFFLHLRTFYHNYIIKKHMEGVWWDQFYYKIILKLHSILKERVKMESSEYEHRYASGVH